MSEKDINNLKEMLVDFNEYSTDYTKTACREYEETIENTLKEIERLNNIIKEVREYIEKNKAKLQLGRDDFTCEMAYSDEVVLANELLQILDKGE